MSVNRRALFASSVAAFAMLLASASGVEAADSGTPVAAPAYRVGDRWVYRGEDGYRVKTRWEETHEVTATGPDGITVRIVKRGEAGESVRNERWSAPGLVMIGAVFDDETRRFTVPLKRYEFPLAPGQRWTQWVDQFDEAAQKQGQINHYVRVNGREQVTTAAGTFDALELHVIMQLDDGDAFRWPTKCNYVVWYAPDARAMVRAKKDAEYLEKSGGPSVIPIRTQHATLELVSFTPGAR